MAWLLPSCIYWDCVCAQGLYHVDYSCRYLKFIVLLVIACCILDCESEPRIQYCALDYYKCIDVKMSIDIASFIVSWAYDICCIITSVAMLFCLLDTVVNEPFQALLRCSVF